MDLKIFLMSLMTASALSGQGNAQQLKYPETRRQEHYDEYHGVQVADPYRWLEDDRSVETAAWVKAQNDVTFGYLNAIPFRKRFSTTSKRPIIIRNIRLREKRAIISISIKTMVCKTRRCCIARRGWKAHPKW